MTDTEDDNRARKWIDSHMDPKKFKTLDDFFEAVGREFYGTDDQGNVKRVMTFEARHRDYYADKMMKAKLEQLGKSETLARFFESEEQERESEGFFE